MPRQVTAPAAPQVKSRYRIIDNRATSLVFNGRGFRITPEMRRDGVEMTAKEADYYVTQQAIAPWDTDFSGGLEEMVLKTSSGENPIPEREREGKPPEEDSPKRKR